MTAVMSPACLEVLQKNNQRGCSLHTDPPNLMEPTDISPRFPSLPLRLTSVWKRQAATFFLGKINKLTGKGRRAEPAMGRGARGYAGQVVPAGGSGSAAAQIKQNRAK